MTQPYPFKIVISADHRGFHHKLQIKEQLRKHDDMAIEWLDAGSFTAERCDYPEFAIKAVREIRNGVAQCGILLCGSGNGMAIAANRFPGIYAALAWNDATARLAKEDDNANILVLPADFITSHEAISMINQWLSATFKGDRYQARLEMLEKLVLEELGK